MLSPNARNLVFVSRGAVVTVTVKLQDAVWFAASVAEHSTLVVPAVNVDPDCLVQDT
jgi:hypothetical protein